MTAVTNPPEQPMKRRGFLGALVALSLVSGIGRAQTVIPSMPPLANPGVAANSVSTAQACEEPAPACAPRFWFSAEQLLWWTKSQPLPVPVLSTGPLDDPATR